MLYFLLLALILSEIQAQDTNCVSLSTSEACPAYSQFYVDLGGLADNYPFLVNVTSVAQFDQRMRNYVNSTSFYLFPLGCLSSNYNPKVAYARYSLARLCADMVQNSHSLGPCNFENDIYPPPLCQNTCLEWVDDVDRITSDPNICSNTSLRNKTLNYYSEQCTSWQGVNGTIDQNCISGLANEPFYCGFQDEYLACNYCKYHSSDTCCNIVNCKHPLTTGTIIGITIGSLIMTALLLFASFCFCSRKTSTPPLDPFACSATSHRDMLKQQQSATPPNGTTMIHREKSSRSFIAKRQDSMTSQKPADINNNHHSNSNYNYTNSNNNDIYLVAYSYQPQMPDEIQLDEGDIICVAVTFDDGWGVGFNITTDQKGAFPMVCISKASEEELNQLSDEINTISSTS